MPPEANGQTSRPEKSGKPWVSRLAPYVAGVGAGALIYASLYCFPLVNGIDSPFFYPLAGVGFVAVGGIGAFATWGLFVTLNGALDSGPGSRRVEVRRYWWATSPLRFDASDR